MRVPVRHAGAPWRWAHGHGIFVRAREVRSARSVTEACRVRLKTPSNTHFYADANHALSFSDFSKRTFMRPEKQLSLIKIKSCTCMLGGGPLASCDVSASGAVAWLGGLGRLSPSPVTDSLQLVSSAHTSAVLVGMWYVFE